MNSSKILGIEIRPARSLADFLFLRALRNRVRLKMTNHTSAIGYLQQLRFFLHRPENILVFIANANGKRAGYLLLRRHAERTFITEAVEGKYRGRGIATAMVRHAQILCTDLTAEILAENAASIRLHQATGFKRENEKKGIAVFRFVRSQPVVQGNQRSDDA